MTVFDYAAIKCRGQFVRKYYGIGESSNGLLEDQPLVVLAIVLLIIYMFTQRS